MKRVKNISTAILAVILFATTVSAQRLDAGNAESNFSVKYIGVEENYLCFQVNFSGNDSKVASLRIDDKVEGELYAESFPAIAQTLRFRIEKKDGQELIFKLVAGKKVFAKTFSATTRLTEKTVVKENEVAAL